MTRTRSLLSRRIARVAATLTVAACVLPVADASAGVNVTSVRTFTCLNRTSDGFNGCWMDGTTPGDIFNNAREWQKGDGCNGVHVIYRGDTPATRSGIPRAESIGLVLGDNNGNYLPAPIAWFGLGSGTNQYYGNPTDRQPGSVISAMIALNTQNRFARVDIYFTGETWCRWKKS